MVVDTSRQVEVDTTGTSTPGTSRLIGNGASGRSVAPSGTATCTGAGLDRASSAFAVVVSSAVDAAPGPVDTIASTRPVNVVSAAVTVTECSWSSRAVTAVASRSPSSITVTSS